MFESTCRIHVVSRIDTYFFCIVCRHICHFRVEVYIGNQWCHITVLAQGGIDILQVLGFLYTLSGEAHIFSSRINNAFDLCHTGICILRKSISHTLYADRIGAAHRGGSNIYFRCFTSGIVEYVHYQLTLYSYFTSFKSSLALTIFFFKPSL